MQPYTGSVILPTQIRNFRDAGSAIVEAKNKFMECLPPPQYIPHELRESFAASLHEVLDLSDVMEPNLHKVYLLVDKEKLDEMIGIMVYCQIQRRMLEVPPPEEPQFIMTHDDVIQSLRILTGIERVVTAAIAWTNSEDGARFRRDMNHAHAAMEASFDRWLNAVLPENLMEPSSSEPGLSQSSDPPLSPLLLSCPDKTSSRRPKSLPKLQIKPLPETPFFTCEASPYPVLTPPPLSPLCRYSHNDTKVSTCRFCCNIPRPRKPSRLSMPRLSSFYLNKLQQSETTPPRKRPRHTPSMSELFLPGNSYEDPNTLIRPSDTVSVVEGSPPSPPSLHSLSSGESSGGESLSPIASTSQLELRPLLSLPSRYRRRKSTPQDQSTSKGKRPFWMRLLKGFLPFL